jgi:hypothetical protein
MAPSGRRAARSRARVCVRPPVPRRAMFARQGAASWGYLPPEPCEAGSRVGKRALGAPRPKAGGVPAGSPLAGELLRDLQDLVDHLRVEGRGRFVEQQRHGLHGEGAGDGHPPVPKGPGRCPQLPAAGELRRVLTAWEATPTRSSSSRERRSACSFSRLRTLTWASETFCSTVLWANRLKDWKTMPTSARRFARALPSSGSGCPSSVMEPEWMVSRRLIALHSVDFPDP